MEKGEPARTASRHVGVESALGGSEGEALRYPSDHWGQRSAAISARRSQERSSGIPAITGDRAQPQSALGGARRGPPVSQNPLRVGPMVTRC
ncbi:hypothetical protein chiPu_0012333 [Chiloscyllium punctatum]|uniref:Uncharacterized protein n=1 Tax=Chiloscyllium punctatum TaxID=137246 RepID=A0A401SU08_CHIPU|nr:hypothetical protein [Chiloscyllium punctatum]